MLHFKGNLSLHGTKVLGAVQDHLQNLPSLQLDTLSSSSPELLPLAWQGLEGKYAYFIFGLPQ